MLTLRVQEDDTGRRLDRIIRKAMPEVPLSAIYRYIREGVIKVNNKKTRRDYKTRLHDTITVYIHAPPPYPPPQAGGGGRCDAGGLDIIFENKDIIILNKKSGQLSAGHNSLQSRVENYLNGKLPPSLSFKSGALHRLDRETSGAIMFSKSLRGARYISTALKNHTLKKIYLAIAEGVITKPEIWEDALIRVKREKKTYSANKNTYEKNARPARAIVTPLYSHDNLTLIKVEITTGRTHQIRCQAALRGHPLAGDTRYNSTLPPLLPPPLPPFFLHAQSIEFPPDNPLELPRCVTAPIHPCISRAHHLFRPP